MTGVVSLLLVLVIVPLAVNEAGELAPGLRGTWSGGAPACSAQRKCATGTARNGSRTSTTCRAR